MFKNITSSVILLYLLVFLAGCSVKEVPQEEFISNLVKDVEIDLSKINREVISLTEADKVLRSYKGDLRRIGSDIDSLIERYPESYDLKALKINFLQRSDKAQAKEFVENLYLADSLNSHHQFFYGTMLDPEKGKEYFVRMIKKKKDDPFCYLGLAFSLLYTKIEDLYIPAKFVYLSILKDPGIDDSFEVLGYIFNSLGRKEDLAVLNGIMLVKDPANTNAFDNLFYYYYTGNEKDKALDLMETFIKNNPGVLSGSSIAENYMYLEKYDIAMDYVKKARDSKDADGLLDYLEAKLEIISDNLPKGVKLLEKYASANPNDRNLSYRLTDVLFAEKLYGNLKYLTLLKKIENGAPTIGDKAPHLSGMYMDSTEYNGTSFSGKVYMIDFWAEWCSPCKNEMPNVISAYENYNPKGFEIIGVNLDNVKSRDKAVSYIKDNSLTWNHIYSGLDWRDPNVALYKVNGIPSTFLIDRKGIIRYKNIRGKDLLESKIEKLLDEVTAN